MEAIEHGHYKTRKNNTDSRDLEMYKNQSDTQQQNWRVRHGGGSRIGVRPQRNRLWHKKKSTQFSRRRCNFCKSYTKQNQSRRNKSNEEWIENKQPPPPQTAREKEEEQTDLGLGFYRAAARARGNGGTGFASAYL